MFDCRAAPLNKGKPDFWEVNNNEGKEEFKMGIFGDFLEGFLEGMTDSIEHTKKNTFSSNYESGNCDYHYDYTFITSEPLKDDYTYLKVFNDALRQIKKDRPHDTYITQILQYTSGRALRAVESGYSGNHYPDGFCVWRIFFKYNSEYDNSFTLLLRLRTPNSAQLDSDGIPIKSGSGYVVDGSGSKKTIDAQPSIEELKKEECERNKERELQQQKNRERMMRPSLDSFLGIKFLDDIKTCLNGNDDCVDLRNGLCKYKINCNKFLSFDSYFALVADGEDKIVGIGCEMTIENEDEISETKEILLSLLSKKYQRPIETSASGYTIFFYDDEVIGDSIKNTIHLFIDRKSITITAFDSKEVNMASIRYLKKSNEKKKQWDEALSAL